MQTKYEMAFCVRVAKVTRSSAVFFTRIKK
jgi:hypothetical protein